jgi:hypothetical protein
MFENENLWVGMNLKTSQFKQIIPYDGEILEAAVFGNLLLQYFIQIVICIKLITTRNFD